MLTADWTTMAIILVALLLVAGAVFAAIAWFGFRLYQRLVKLAIQLAVILAAVFIVVTLVMVAYLTYFR